MAAPGLFCWLAGVLENMGADAGMLGHIWLMLLPGESFAPLAVCPLTPARLISRARLTFMWKSRRIAEL